MHLNSHCQKITFVALIVFLSRVLFIGNGFGLDPDSWRLANTARTIALTGEYSYSRAPGYPIPELVYSLMWEAPPFYFNLVTAIFSVGVFLLAAVIFRKANVKLPLFSAFTMLFIPVIYVNSVSTMDYMWALTFVMGSLWLTLERRYLMAGALLGLAAGCRITSLGMVIPLGVLIYLQQTDSLRSLLKFFAATLAVGLVVFLPGFSTYRLGFLTFYEGEYPAALALIKRASVDVWGIPGSIAILAAILLLMARLGKVKSLLMSKDALFLASVTAIALYVLLFLRLPYEAGYLIPVTPFLFIMLGTVLERKVLTGVYVLIILSPFVLGINNRELAIDGPILQDRLARNETEKLATQVLQKASQLENDSVVVAGYYLPILEWQLHQRPLEGIRFVYLVPPEELASLLEEQKPIYYLPGIDQYNQEVYSENLVDAGGLPLIP